jgi:Tfp pilus assembly protein PilE
MLKQNQNRGAGLVTVVTVLAVCSILLAGVVALSFNHYKNAIRQTQSREELAEIELFAEIVNAALTNYAQDTVFESDLLLSFYSVERAENSWVYVSRPISEQSLYEMPRVVVVNEGDRYTVSCGNSSREYHFTDDGFKPYKPSVEGDNNESQ